MAAAEQCAGAGWQKGAFGATIEPDLCLSQFAHADYVHLSQLTCGSWQKCGEVNVGQWLYAVSEEYGDSDFLRDPR